MIADFNDVFNDNDAGTQIPQEILALINRDLPSNFCCYEDPDRGIIVGPRPTPLDPKFTLKVNFILDDKLKNILKDIPRERWLEYFYRTQKPIPVENVRVGDEEKQIPIEQTMQNPLSDSVRVTECYMCPEPFPDPVPITIKPEDGDALTLMIKRQPYESMDEIMFSNVNLPVIKMTIILNETDARKSKIKYSVIPTKAANVSEAVTALHAFKGLYDGTASINGHKETASRITDEQFDETQITSALDLWTSLEKLEKILSVTFNPAAEFPQEDEFFLSELETTFLEKKCLKWNHPFDHFHVEGLSLTAKSMEEIIGKGKMSMKFLEGPIPATLLGAEFELYSETEMSGFIITNIEWDDESRTSGEMYIADEVNGESWVLSRKYLTVGEWEERAEGSKGNWEK